MSFKNSIWTKLLLTLFTSAILIVIIAVTDRLYGKYFTNNTLDLIYPPCTSAHHKSTEFDISVKINSLGFRDHEYSVTKKKKYRVAVIGDSFTFGWGVDLEDCWIKVLEKELNASGMDVEILNLGKGGASPADYAQTAANAIPALKPDLVIIAVLQANDLHQLIHAYDSLPVPKVEQARQGYIAEKTISLLTRAFPNYMKRLSVKNIDISAQWKREAPALLSSFRTEQKQRYGALDENVKTDFNLGLLNPWLIHQAVYYPGYFTQPLDTADLDVVIGISAMADFLTNIKQTCAASQSKLAVISIPNVAYSSKQEMKALEKFGFSIPDSLFGNKLADVPAQLAAHEAGIEFYSPAANFRDTKKESTLYYPYDGHLTKEGNLLLAGFLKDFFAKKIKDE